MLDYTIDVLLIGLALVLVIQLLKTPIKIFLTRKGLGDSEKMSKIFNAIVTLISYAMSFGAACIYFHFFKHYPLFADTRILTYTVGIVGASQAIYKLLETYGRDGLITLIKVLIAKAKEKKITNIKDVPEINTDTLAAWIYTGIKERFEGASITESDVKQIIEEKIINHP